MATHNTRHGGWGGGGGGGSNWFGNGWPELPSWWCIKKEKNCFVLCKSGPLTLLLKRHSALASCSMMHEVLLIYS